MGEEIANRNKLCNSLIPCHSILRHLTCYTISKFNRLPRTNFRIHRSIESVSSTPSNVITPNIVDLRVKDMNRKWNRIFWEAMKGIGCCETMARAGIIHCQFICMKGFIYFSLSLPRLKKNSDSDESTIIQSTVWISPIDCNRCSHQMINSRPSPTPSL